MEISRIAELSTIALSEMENTAGNRSVGFTVEDNSGGAPYPKEKREPTVVELENEREYSYSESYSMWTDKQCEKWWKNNLQLPVPEGLNSDVMSDMDMQYLQKMFPKKAPGVHIAALKKIKHWQEQVLFSNHADVSVISESGFAHLLEQCPRDRFSIFDMIKDTDMRETFEAATQFQLPKECYFDVEKDEIHQVFVNFVIEQIGKINPVQGCFEVGLTCEIRWTPDREDTLRMLAAALERDEKIEPTYFPKLRVLNARDCQVMRDWSLPDLYFKKGNEHEHAKFACYSSCKWFVTCTENFEMERFPFDCQDMDIRLRREEPITEFSPTKEQFLPRGVWVNTEGKLLRSTTKCVLNMDLNLQPDEQWVFHDPLIFFKNTDPDDDAAVYSEVSIHLKARRVYHHYIFRLCTVLFALGIASFGVFFLQTEDSIEGEMAHLTTITLSIVAFMFIFQQDIPKIPTMTWMDLYCYYIFAFTLLQMGGVVFLNLAQNGHVSSWLEDWKYLWHSVVGLCAAVFVLGHVGFGFLGRCYQSTERKKLSMTEEQHRLFEEKRAQCCCSWCCCAWRMFSCCMCTVDKDTHRTCKLFSHDTSHVRVCEKVKNELSLHMSTLGKELMKEMVGLESRTYTEFGSVAQAPQTMVNVLSFD